MNFLAHLYLAHPDEALMLGGLVGDFVRGQRALKRFPVAVQEGIRLHRRVDRFTDSNAEVKALRRQFPLPFRRFAGIIIDVAFDHELARRWPAFSEVSPEDFDRQVRALLARHESLVPNELHRFMAYADRRGLFAAYRHEEEMLFSLVGIGRRLSRDNPLDRAAEIWPELRGPCAHAFEVFFPQLQGEVESWLNRRSTMTGS